MFIVYNVEISFFTEGRFDNGGNKMPVWKYKKTEGYTGVCIYIVYIYILFLAELLLEQRLIFTRTHMSPLAVRGLQNLQLCCAFKNLKEGYFLCPASGFFQFSPNDSPVRIL